MPNIGAGKTTLAIGDGAETEVFATIGPLRDPLPVVSKERAALDNTTTADDTEKTRAGMKKIAPMAFKIESASGNSAIGALNTAFESGAEINWEFTFPVEGGTEKVVFSAWVQKLDVAPAIKDHTMLTFTLNPNSTGAS